MAAYGLLPYWGFLLPFLRLLRTRCCVVFCAYSRVILHACVDESKAVGRCLAARNKAAGTQQATLQGWACARHQSLLWAGRMTQPVYQQFWVGQRLQCVEVGSSTRAVLFGIVADCAGHAWVCLWRGFAGIGSSHRILQLWLMCVLLEILLGSSDMLLQVQAFCSFVDTVLAFPYWPSCFWLLCMLF